MLIHSTDEMLQFGEQFAQQIKTTTVIELVGDVGVGKTTFVRGLAKGLGVKAPISSPSFTISRSYMGDKFALIHYDFYRLDDPGLMADDLVEAISDNDTVTVIEWGQSISEILPKNHIKIEIKYIDEETREVIAQ